jgi:hypothetical protein
VEAVYRRPGIILSMAGILVLIFSGLISFALISLLKNRHSFIDAAFLRRLFFYHLILALAYYGYALFNPSDSKFYYEKVVTNFRGMDWSSYYGTSTIFIEFVGYPFIKFFGFSYEAIMALFSLFGFLGFVYFYIFFRENIRYRHKFLGFDLLTVFFFLPNLHFWSSSFGKGSIIFLGLGLFFYGISNIKSRIIHILIGGFIIYHVRPHVMLVVLISSGIGFMFSTKGVKMSLRLLFLAGATIAFIFIYRDVLSLVGIDEEQGITQGLDLSHRASELSKSTSGVDISSYSLPMQLFTFLYRPLFIDAPGLLGIIVSFENLLYLMLTFQMMRTWKGMTFFARGNFLVKTAFFSFLTVSIALAQVSSNLGLAMRQKSQVMILFMFVIISFLDEQKLNQWKVLHRRRLRMKREHPPDMSIEEK